VSLGFKPMLAVDGKAQTFPSATNWRMERKFDGWRFLIHARGHGDVRFYQGRSATQAKELPEVAAVLAAGLPDDTVLDAEVVVPGERSPAVATALARGTYLQAHVFDLLRVSGEDTIGLEWLTRRRLLFVAAGGFVDPVFMVDSFPASIERHEQWIAQGWEGSVLKRVDGFYRPGRRSGDWIKVKPQTTAEARVTGFETGQGSWAGGYGAFTVRMLGSDAETTVAIPTAELRADVTAHPERYLQHVCQLRVSAIMPSGKPRHPVFDHMREDRV
jgi:bifunctional non-homologous end joining protein LigD